MISKRRDVPGKVENEAPKSVGYIPWKNSVIHSHPIATSVLPIEILGTIPSLPCEDQQHYCSVSKHSASHYLLGVGREDGDIDNPYIMFAGVFPVSFSTILI